MARSVSYEHLLRLARQRAIDGKGGLAASLAKMCLDAQTDLRPAEIELAYDILRDLIDKVEIQVRRQIADYLADRTDVPRELIDFLLDDAVHVAYPIIVRSRQLGDDDLLALIDRQGRGHAIAVASRPGIADPVSDRLVALGDAEIDTALLRNREARIGRKAMETLVDRSIEAPDSRELIVKRPDLPDDLARRMYIWVGEALRHYIAQTFAIDGASLDPAVDAAVWRALGDSAEPAGATGPPESAGTAESDGVADPEPEADRAAAPSAERRDMDPAARLRQRAARLLAVLESEGPAAFVAAYAAETGLDRADAAGLFETATPETTAIACKALGLDVDGYVAVLRAFREDAAWTAFAADGRLDRACAYFDRIDAVGAARVVTHWRTAPPGTPTQ